MLEHCKNCLFMHKPEGTNNVFICRRNPPIVVNDKGVSITRHPNVLPWNWCGEWYHKNGYGSRADNKHGCTEEYYKRWHEKHG